MADMNNTEEQIVKSALRQDAGAPVEEEYAPQYRMMSAGEKVIPVSKHAGKLWQNRKDQVIAKQKATGIREAWSEAIRYYRNDQSTNSRGDDLKYRYTRDQSRSSDKQTETENVVFANVSAFVPALYAKNPDSEISWGNPEQESLATQTERLLDVLAARKTAPGINLKPKMRRAVVQATLTNAAFIEVGWTNKQDSTQQTLQEIAKISEELKNAKSAKMIEKLEGQLMALERRVDVLRPEGPWTKVRYVGDVLIDPDAEEADMLSDANWIMIADMLPTEMLLALYSKKDDDKEQYKSIYKPTHVIRAGTNIGDNEEVNPSSLFSYDGDTKNAAAYGYADDQSFRAAQRTRVWYVWDRSTRRVYLYNDADWAWPLWVWDDPYQFPDFFPLSPLIFATDPLQLYAKSEVAYYLDQQDAVNDINTEMKKIRDWVTGKYVYNKRIIKDDTMVAEFVKGAATNRVMGIDAEPDQDISKLIHALAPPSIDHVQLFMNDKNQQMQAIDRLSGVTSVMRGAEFKTNTTNKAIETYESQTQTRLDEKMDAIEDCLGDVFQKVAFLCLRFMDVDTVTSLIGPQAAQGWTNLSPEEITYTLSLRIVGGSTLKPTSRMKKELAMNLGQVLGQFTSASPMSFYLAAKVFRRAFADDVIMSDEEWEMLTKSIEQAVGAATQQQAGGEGAPAEGGGDPTAVLAQIEQFIDELPEELRKGFGMLLARGAPVREAVAQVVNAATKNAAPQAAE